MGLAPVVVRQATLHCPMAKKEAVRLEQQLREELARRYEPLTLDTMFAKYWQEHASNLPSAYAITSHIRRLLQIIGKDKPLADLSNKDVSNYVTVRRKDVREATHTESVRSG
jgi:hypothetical protein